MDLDKKDMALKKKLQSLITTHQKFVELSKKIDDMTGGEIVVGYPFNNHECQVFRGIEKIADLFGIEVSVSDSGIKEFPVRKETKVDLTDLFSIESGEEDAEM